jgi:hypothetical protein
MIRNLAMSSGDDFSCWPGPVTFVFPARFNAALVDRAF